MRSSLKKGTMKQFNKIANQAKKQFQADHSTEKRGAVYYEPDTEPRNIKDQDVPGGLKLDVMLEATRLANFCYLEKSGCYWKSNKRDQKDFAAIKPEHLSVGLMVAMGKFPDLSTGMNLKLISSEYDQVFDEGKGHLYSGIIKEWRSDTDLVILHNPDEKLIAISFRGTESGSDVRVDMNALSAEWPYTSGPKLHVSTGFKNAHDSVIEPITKTLKAMWKSGSYERILVCGHSLGGALAHLHAHALSYILEDELSKSPLPPEERLMCYTIGAPKAGNAEFLKDYTTRVGHTYRLVNDHDIIPRLPVPRRNHVGVPIIANEEHFYINPSFETKRKFESESEQSERISDHMPPNYLKVVLSHYVRQQMTELADKLIMDAWTAYVKCTDVTKTTALEVQKPRGDDPKYMSLKPVTVREPHQDSMKKILVEAFGSELATQEVLDHIMLYARKCLEINIFRPWEKPFDEDTVDLSAFRIAVFDLIGNPDNLGRKRALEIARLRVLFDLIDSDGDGLISAEEYVEAHKKIQPESAAEIEEKGAVKMLHDQYKMAYNEYNLEYSEQFAPTEISFEEFKMAPQVRGDDPLNIIQKLKA
mmetsp:Transcript_25329/g.100017  ORF Transcript_25329/g.100017 Transcript_25329/m.100017 type:complete len:590 (-) Transcript_25329:3984-5753(-)